MARSEEVCRMNGACKQCLIVILLDSEMMSRSVPEVRGIRESNQPFE